MARASGIISKCMRPQETGADNTFYSGIKGLDGIDAWRQFLIEHATMNMSDVERAALYEDAYKGWAPWYVNHKPGVHAKILDLDKNAYYIDVDPKTGKVVLDTNGDAVYRYHGTNEVVDWNKVKKQKEKTFWFFTKDKERMVSAPSRYEGAKTSMMEYVDSLNPNRSNWGLLTEAGWERLRYDTKRFFDNIESGKGQKGWWNIIYDLFTSEKGNHWYFLSKILGNFDLILEDRDTAERMLGFQFVDVSFREFSEAAAAYANMQRGGNLTVVDVLGGKYADMIYGKKAKKLFIEDPKTGRVTKAKNPEDGVLSKSYFMKLTISQQIEQIRSALGDLAPTMSKYSMMWKIKVRYNTWGYLLKAINFIGKPSVFAMLMSSGKGLSGFMPLLILNSGMFITEMGSRGPKLDGNWKAFFQKWNLIDGLPDNIEGYSAGIGQTFGDFARRGVKMLADMTNQGWFNAGDSLMQNSYMIRWYQQFFEAQFPGIKSVEELNRVLERMNELNPGAAENMLSAARTYVEYAIRQATTNSPISAALTRVHVASNPLNQTRTDTLYAMWHFFAGWGYNKILGAVQIFKKGMGNVYRGDIGAKYLDNLLASGADAETIHGKMVRNYLENEDMIYMLHKLYISMIYGKYIDRLSEDGNDKDGETIFKDFTDMMSFMDIFSGDYAALTANPEGRLIKTFLEIVLGEYNSGAGIEKTFKASAAAVTKEAFRSFFRKLYFPQIGVEMASKLNASWDEEEIKWWPMLRKSISDNVNAYMYYLKDQTENGEYTYWIPRGANSYVNAILGKTSETAKLISEQSRLITLHNLKGSIRDDNSTFHNWVIYNFPFLKQWNISQIKEVEGFADAVDGFRNTLEYRDLINGKLPSDFNDYDWEYVYNTITGRLARSEDAIDNKTFFTDYSFVTEDGTIAYDKNRQSQENLLHLLMSNGLTKEQAEGFQDMFNKKTDKTDEEAIRTLAYLEAKTPGAGYQALAYVMSNEWFNYVFKSGEKYKDGDPESEAMKKKKMEEGKIYAAKKYAEYIPYIDRQFSWTQIILHYAKTHDTTLAPFIEWNGAANNGTMKLVTPGAERDSDGNIRQNKVLKQNFQAQLMVDIEAAGGNPNARKLMNGFAKIFDTSKYENADGTLDPDYAVDILNRLEIVYDHIESLPLDNAEKRIIKQGALMFGDKILPSIIKDPHLMNRDDVKTVVNDWLSYWYKEFEEIDKIAQESAEDRLANDEWKRYGSKSNLFKGGASKQFTGFLNWYNYLRNKAYSDGYLKYRVYDWTPRSGQGNYLSEREFEDAKRAQAQAMYRGDDGKSSSKKSKGKSDEESIGVSMRRGKSIQFYKREDIDKPVDYRIPWRKRWVRRGSGVKPIAPTTWKHLTPTPKR